MCVDIPIYYCLYLSNMRQEMGLGKTLSVLALIAWFLDTLENESLSAQRSIPRATLVVAPKSSKMQMT
jgi:SWI/SNF-related matrix-associated actin-dependent regulator of chromatin subfamily A3